MSKGPPIPEPTPQEKQKLLEGWLVIVQGECDAISEEKDSKTKIYLEMKSKYDRWLATRMRWINKLEKRLHARQKQYKEIEAELSQLKDSNTPQT